MTRENKQNASKYPELSEELKKEKIENEFQIQQLISKIQNHRLNQFRQRIDLSRPQLLRISSKLDEELLKLREECQIKGNEDYATIRALKKQSAML